MSKEMLERLKEIRRMLTFRERQLRAAESGRIAMSRDAIKFIREEIDELRREIKILLNEEE